MYDRTKYQLLAVSALYIVIKINERVIFSAEKLAAISHGTYSVENIEAMECTILNCLSWRVCAPTAYQVGYVILDLMDISRRESYLEELAFRTENAVRDYQLAIQFPGTVALMAIMNVIENVQIVNDGESFLLLKALQNVLVDVKSSTTEE
jgi:hypothetical protein